MTTLEITLIMILWVILGIFVVRKQDLCSRNSARGVVPGEIVFLYFIMAPLVFIGAIIRQVMWEDWK